MRKPIIAGNWKMNGNKTDVHSLLTQLKEGVQHLPKHIACIVFPPSVFLEATERLLTENTNNQPRIHWGAQNVSAEPKGAFTGEISTAMLEEFGCHYVLIGHSERRLLYGETDAIIQAKFTAVINNSKLTPLLCVGETQTQREQGETEAVLYRQLDAILKKHQDGVQLLNRAILAYEPVWAIGTGLAATPEQAQEVHAKLRAYIAHYNPDIAKQVQILYGGSVKPENAASLFSMPDIDGGLVGGASLHADQFLAIARALTS